ncbi:acylneuraminate cytidylyltransferase family protein [Vibrio sp. Vb2133]|uniref:acylneuraminate cytidylyltransferase family protein n=1 Tax=Vibrio TaxID=662 RepID=UPI001EFD6412|nr:MULTISPECIES: acylneuraminate cytidylyltransferase family protein [Vibrio]MCG9612070.1 acylneuraminate cytidylyltransferase family protein [Vibrio harveyi]MCG9670180.1 acylneuraminate cytidylyltransferase family protein [Vibrio harveyi]MDW1748531.1 acylneuraminate cytidylyltransferase family protein [Vibrio sp. Vb2133]MDW1791489.1 acylneuraminate cytidylyltransferase family protein [Vibrio sp. Vb2132]MDW3147833.1 acylneuraminate cytidylyltransferase family protein [Vibrio sp. 2132-1]
MSNCALITARGGSKGLPRKNVLPLKGKPVIAWTIEAALECSQIDRVFVTTDDQEIADVSRQFGAEVLNRPSHLATDEATSEAVISHAIAELERTENITTIVLLQPTSPLRSSLHISDALSLYYEKGATCTISVFEPGHCPAKAYQLNENGTISGLYGAAAPYTRRQDLPTTYQPNGAIYIFSVDSFKQFDQIPREGVYPYEMSEKQSADIDRLEDLLNIERIMEDDHE